MEGLRKSRPVIGAMAMVLAVLTLPAATAAAACPHSLPRSLSEAVRIAGEGKQPENRGPGVRDKCKRTPGSTKAPKGCPDGGERLPNDNKRSPLDSAPPLTPLVA